MSVIAHVDGQEISIRDMPEVLRGVETCLSDGRGFTLFTLTLDRLLKRRQNPAVREAYARATYVSADGWPVVALAKRGSPELRRTTSRDLMVPLCRMAARRRVPVYLFGSTYPALVGAALELRRLCPGLEVRDLHAPALDFDPASASGIAAAETIAVSGAGLCFVALGSPKQEIFADLARTICPNVGFICVGGTLDVLAGLRTQAPDAMRRLGLDWAWRLARHPRRLSLRYLRCALLFAELTIRSSARAA